MMKKQNKNKLVENVNRKKSYEEYMNEAYYRAKEDEQNEAKKLKEMVYKQSLQQQQLEYCKKYQDDPKTMENVMILGKVRVKDLWNIIQSEKYDDSFGIKVNNKFKAINTEYLRDILSPYRHTDMWVVYKYYPQSERLSFDIYNPSINTFFIRKIGYEL